MSEGNGRSAEMVTLTVDGKEVAVPWGTLIIRAAEAVGVEIPRFCDHPLLEPVAACRQCYVSVEGQRKLMTSCSTPVTEGMVVHTQFTDPEVHQAQEAVIEFLLLNHPLDCPVCDRGGECPLQDQALAYGSGRSRYIEAKRTYRKPLLLSPLVALDRERCVLCARCTRFCDEISGDRFIELFDRAAAEQVSISPGEDFRSPFSGNTIQICPVGALTARTYRFAARPFDLKSADTVCPHCAAGCNLRVDLRRGEVVRHLARDNYEVNDAWLCDKGRFAFRFPDTNRLTTPLLRGRGLEPVSFGEALSSVAAWSKEGPAAFLAGGRLSDEDAFALSKLARTVFGTNDVDHRTAGGLDVPLEIEQAQASGMPVTYRDIERAKAILVVGLDAEQELPIVHLRIRKAARRGARVFVIHPRRTRLHDLAEHVLSRPGDETSIVQGLAGDSGDMSAGGFIDTPQGRIGQALREAGPQGLVLAGPRLAESPGAVAAAAALAQRTGAKFALLCRRANERGALKAGLHPMLLPGGRGIEAADRWVVEEAWGGPLPSRPGRDSAGILEAAARHDVRVLFLAGVDPLTDFPDAALARRALENVAHKVVLEVASDNLRIYADAMLPAAAFVEKDGHYTDWEGRAQRIRSVRAPQGLARSDWEIFQKLSEVMGKDMGFHSLKDLHVEMGRLLAPHGVAPVDVRTPPRSPSARLGGGPPAYAAPPLPETEQATGNEALPDHQLLLFTYPLLVDEGTMSVGADELKAALEEPPFLELNHADAEQLDISDGDMVRIRTAAGEALLPARVTDGIAPGSVFVPYNQPGFAANGILSGRRVTAVTIERAQAAQEVASA